MKMTLKGGSLSKVPVHSSLEETRGDKKELVPNQSRMQINGMDLIISSESLEGFERILYKLMDECNGWKQERVFHAFCSLLYLLMFLYFYASKLILLGVRQCYYKISYGLDSTVNQCAWQ